MALQDPVAIYDAANDVDAHLLCNLLNEAGVEAYVTEDDAQVGQFLRPQVWVDRSLSTVRSRYCRTTNVANSHKRRPKQMTRLWNLPAKNAASAPPFPPRKMARCKRARIVVPTWTWARLSNPTWIRTWTRAQKKSREAVLSAQVRPIWLFERPAGRQ